MSPVEPGGASHSMETWRHTRWELLTETLVSCHREPGERGIEEPEAGAVMPEDLSLSINRGSDKLQKMTGTLVDGWQAMTRRLCVPGIVDHRHFSPFLHLRDDSFKCTTAVTTHKALDKKKLQGQCLRIVSPVSPAGLHCCCTVIMILILAVIVFSIIVTGALSVRNKEKAIASPEAVYATCPRDWIGFGSKCFYFSEHASNWTSSQTACMELGAHLTHFDSLEELNFLHSNKGDSAAWIGLHRESSEHPWMWTDNTEYNNIVSIRGKGENAYLSDSGISSGRNYIRRRWICSKPNSYA